MNIDSVICFLKYFLTLSLYFGSQCNLIKYISLVYKIIITLTFVLDLDIDVILVFTFASISELNAGKIYLLVSELYPFVFPLSYLTIFMQITWNL